MGQYALGIIGTLLSWFLMMHVGRRKIHFYGLLSQLILLLIIGCLSFSASTASIWAIGGLLIAFTFIYDFTVGPVTYSLISELSSTRLKAKSIVLARAAYNASNIFVNVMTNYQLSETAWDWGARAAFFWAGTCAVSAVWAWFRIPEPKVCLLSFYLCLHLSLSLSLFLFGVLRRMCGGGSIKGAVTWVVNAVLVGDLW